MTRRLTVIVVVILGILAAVQVEAEAQVPQTIGVLPSVHVGNGPQGTAFDRATDTVYVANQGDNTVSVVDARHCNSLDTSGCAQTPATVPTGAGPFAIAIDDATHTVYVANQDDGTVSVIDAATCNGQNQSGCADAGPTIAAGPTPFGIAVDRRTDTVYVTDVGDDAGTVSVINGATCNAITTTGCGQQPATATVGHFPFGVLIDRRDHTVYVTNADDNTVSMIDRRTCNATNTVGCAESHPTVAVGSFPVPLVLDRRSGSLYVGSQNFANDSGAAPWRWPHHRRHRCPDLQRSGDRRVRPGAPRPHRSRWYRRHVDRPEDRDPLRVQQRARREPGAAPQRLGHRRREMQCPHDVRAVGRKLPPL